VLTAALMQHALDVDRVQTVDYLIGDDAYKREWMSHRREPAGDHCLESPDAARGRRCDVSFRRQALALGVPAGRSVAPAGNP